MKKRKRVWRLFVSHQKNVFDKRKFLKGTQRLPCILLLVLTAPLHFHNAIAKEETYALFSEKGAIATVNPRASQAAMDVFDSGGNAVDAAIAAAYTLGVVDSHNSGIGGGCFILVRYADGSIEAIDGREMAPAKAHKDMYMRDGKIDKSLSKHGVLASGIPGSVAAMEVLHERAGSLALSSLILPAADIAQQGFPIDKTMANRLARSHEKLKPYTDIFSNAQGEPLQTGDMLIQKDLAATYRKLAKLGSAFFYKGSWWRSTFAEKAADFYKKEGGIIRIQDFKDYAIVKREPVIGRYKNFQVVGFPPPSSGGVHVQQALNMLSHLDAKFDLRSLSEADRHHLMIETMKRIFADRAYWLGDPDHVDVPKGLLDMAYAKKLAEEISLSKSISVGGHGNPKAFSDKMFDSQNMFSKHTTHISTADRAGNVVAITTTLNTSFGSKVVVPKTGVIMNNQMDDFSLRPGVANAYGLIGAEANAIAALKRPLSSMSPTIVLRDDEPILTLGAAGGPTIISQVLQVLFNTLEYDMTIDEAMAAVRVHHQWRPDRVFIDGFASPALKSQLSAKGHTLKTWPAFGATTAIGIQGNTAAMLPSAAKDSGDQPTETRTFTPAVEPRLIKRNAQ